MTADLYIDTSELPAPEPLEAVVSRLAKIPEGGFLHMRHRMRPQMLLGILEQNGYALRLEESETVDLYIYRSDDEAARKRVWDLP